MYGKELGDYFYIYIILSHTNSFSHVTILNLLKKTFVKQASKIESHHQHCSINIAGVTASDGIYWLEFFFYLKIRMRKNS